MIMLPSLVFQQYETVCLIVPACVGVYWGMPCRISYDLAAHQLLFVDGLHNDTVNASCSLLGCNGKYPSYLHETDR